MKTLLALLLLIPSLSFGLSKDELKEELKYWKSLLDDELISQEDYEQKKEELISISTQSKEGDNKTSTNDFINNIKNIFESDKQSSQKNYYFKGYNLNNIQVEKIQTSLKKLGWNLSVDGVLGNQTKRVMTKWLNCNNYNTFNEKIFTALLNSKSPCSEKEVKNINNYVYCTHLFEETPFPGIIVREGNCLKNEYSHKIPYWCDKSYFFRDDLNIDPKLLAACPNRKTKTVKNIPSKNQPVSSMNANNFDAVINSKSLICEHPSYARDCKNNNWSKKEIFKGEFLNILQDIGYGESLIKVKHESGFVGYINKYDIDIFNPENHKRVKQTKNNQNINQSYNSNTSQKTKSKTSKCSGLNDSKNIILKGLTGYWSEKDACLKISNYSDVELCSSLKWAEERDETSPILGTMMDDYKAESYKRGISCIDGYPYDSSDSSTQAIANQNKTKKQMEKEMQKLKNQLDNLQQQNRSLNNRINNNF